MKNSKNYLVFPFIPVFICFMICPTATKASSITIVDYHIELKNVDADKKNALSVADTLTKKELLNRIKKVIVKELDVKTENIKMQSRFTEDLGADDLSLVELVMGFEEEFKTSIPDNDAETLTTVQKAYDYLVKKLKVKK